jgi:hypothetical protein
MEAIEPSKYSGGLKDVLMSPGTKFDAWSKLARPVHPSQVQKTAVKSQRNPKARISVFKSLSLEGLSNEILDMTIEYLLPQKPDVVALGFSSERLWPLVCRHIQLDILKSAAPWAGKRIAFLGSESEELPPPFIEDGLVKEIVSGEGTGSWSDAQRVFWDLKRPPPLLKGEQLMWRGAIVAHAGKILIPDGRWEQLEEDMRCSRCFPDDQPWVLRNLTTRESVSSAKLGVRVAVRMDGTRGIEFFNFIVLMRTCWSSQPGKWAHLNVHRGVWAGHRFDIVTQAFHESEECLENWRDVTEEVDLEAKDLRQKLVSCPIL